MEIDVDTSGFREIERRARELDGEREVPLGEIFSPAFLQAHTPFRDIDDLFQQAGIDATMITTLDEVQPQLDAVVAAKTKYADWQALFEAAYADYLGRALGIDFKVE